MSESEANEPEDAPQPGDDAPAASRRSFLDVAIVGGGTAVGLASLYPALRFLEPLPGQASDSIVVGRVAEIAPGSSQSIRLGDTPVLVIRDHEGAFRAYEAVCPHLHCIVSYAESTGDIACACHGGKFTINGSPKAGPPKQPLKALRVSVIGDDVVVHRA